MGKELFIPKEKLKKHRISMGLKQSEFAERVAMDQSQYSRRESGKVPISDAEWDRFARELGVSKDDIYESEPKIINIVNNTDNKDNSINAFEITIKAPSNFFQDLNNKLDFLIQKIESK
ncbi:helix-turn-helix transcriptional regulator [Flavobacterium sp.]|jgi:transcriptional regulator with XRE-family HTH domain|uniref:helix-turn-helix domain-containing protein n=1 Tax=Flavobacterium TaxID=237 RepID=UPI0022BBD3C0|nr:helix-turn-helix transcriptional regulator [Flavobacterium sp.]MCZ8090245.1 helix-turn-helix transcriptional regulator [Flavobacterium sp.]